MHLKWQLPGSLNLIASIYKHICDMHMGECGYVALRSIEVTCHPLMISVNHSLHLKCNVTHIVY